jgi:16S rRNA (adenine1518-N6/adenine1519-N6)-dimethyltransferase
MIQKEVAERIVSKHGNKVYGILSVLLQTFYDIKYLFSVDPFVFDPPPKVNSAVIKMVRNNRSDFDTKMLKSIVKAGFGKRRKTLRNALKGLNLPDLLTSKRVFDKRAEQLSVQDFIDLTGKIEETWGKK